MENNEFMQFQMEITCMDRTSIVSRLVVNTGGGGA